MDTMTDSDSHVAMINGLFATIGVRDDRILKLLMLSVGRVLLKDRRCPIGSTSADHTNMLMWIGHIRDWLVVAVADDAKWLSNVDELGQPKKLMKFSTLEAIYLEADRQMARKQRQARKEVALVEGDEKVVFDAGNGWSIVQLLTPNALDRESEVMQHCIGHGAYDEALANQSVAFFSLRDTFGKPHVTFEVRSGYLVQFQGKQNKPPVERYVIRCVPYFNAERVKCNRSGQLVTDVNGAVYSVYDLPDFLSVDGIVSLQNDTNRRLRLPRRIHVTDSLSIFGNAFLNTPEEIVVGKLLFIEGTALSSTPPSLSVGGSLRLEGMDDVVLPSGFRVQGNLILEGSSIKSLPDGLFVRGTLDLKGTNVLELPDDLRCGGINISNTGIKRFNTKVFWEDTPEQRAARSLVATNCALEEIVGTPHFGSLTVNTPMFETPKGLFVKRVFVVSGGAARITTDTTFLGILQLNNCEVDFEFADVDQHFTVNRSTVRFGKNLRCGGIITLKNSKVEQIPNSIQCEALYLADLTIPSLPAEIIASESVMITNVGVSRLEGIIRTSDLWVPSSTTFIGEKIEAEIVTVIEASPDWKMDLVGVRGYLEDGGNLRIPPDGATLLTFEDPPEYLAPNPVGAFVDPLDDR